MKKTYKIEVDCANCAAKIEDAANKVSGVKSAIINFMTQKLTVELDEASDEKEVIAAILRSGKKIERDFEIIF